MADHYTHLFRLMMQPWHSRERKSPRQKSARASHLRAASCALQLLQLHQMIQLDSIGFNMPFNIMWYSMVFNGIQLYSIVFNDSSQIVLHVHVLLVGLPSHVIRSSALEMLP